MPDRKRKTRTSVTLDANLKERLDEMPEVNLSGLVNDVVRDFVVNGKSQRSGLELRLERVEAEIEELEHQLEEKRELKEEIETQLEERSEKSNGTYEHAVEKVMNTIESRVRRDQGLPEVDNLAVTNQAQKANVPPQDLLDEAIERSELVEQEEVKG
jgi:hypothetical protein